MTQDPLVLLPGMNCSNRLWQSLLPRLMEAVPGLDVRQAAVDRPSVPECVTALLKDLPPRFSLAGLSLGGVVALALVRRAPERVSRLCLLSTNPHAPTAEQHRGWADQRRRIADGCTARALQEELLPVLLSQQRHGLDGDVLKMADETGAEVLDRQLAAQSTRIDERPGLGEVRVPTLLVAAEHDALVSVARHEETAALVPEARLVVLAGVGHLSTLEAPDRVAGAITGWLS